MISYFFNLSRRHAESAVDNFFSWILATTGRGFVPKGVLLVARCETGVAKRRYIWLLAQLDKSTQSVRRLN